MWRRPNGHSLDHCPRKSSVDLLPRARGRSAHWKIYAIKIAQKYSYVYLVHFVLWRIVFFMNRVILNKKYTKVQTLSWCAHFALYVLFTLCALFKKMLCTSEIIMNCRVHFTMLGVAIGGGRRVSSVYLHRHTSGCTLRVKKPSPTRWKLVPGTVDGSSGKVHKECKKCKECTKCKPPVRWWYLT